MKYGTSMIRELTEVLPNVTRIDFLGEDEGRGNRRRIHYRFFVKPSMVLPPWLQVFGGILKPFTWKQWFELDEEHFRVFWRVDPEGVPAKTHSEGITHLVPEGDGCQLNLDGEIHLEIAGHMPGPKPFLLQVEEWLTPSVTQMVGHNLEGFYSGLKVALDQKFPED